MRFWRWLSLLHQLLLNSALQSERPSLFATTVTMTTLRIRALLKVFTAPSSSSVDAIILVTIGSTAIDMETIVAETADSSADKKATATTNTTTAGTRATEGEASKCC